MVSSEIPELSLFESVNIAAMTAMTAFWFSCVGASLGSFLNVIVYRMPRNLSLVRGPSSCPTCQQPIAMRDNIPLFGWIKLRGRCRACRCAIPIRYPLVELAAAAQFVVLFYVELISGGANLPVRQTEYYAGVLWTVWYLKYPDLMQLYLFHCLLLYLSLAFLLIALDRRLPPRRLVLFSLIAGFLWLVIEPHLLPVLGLSRGDVSQIWSQRETAVWNGLVGMVSGAGMGMVLGLAHPAPDDLSTPASLCVVFSICGLYLGPSVLLSVAAISLIIYLVGQSIALLVKRLKNISLIASLVVALHIQIFCWRQLAETPYWPSHTQTRSYHLEILLLVVGIVVAIRDRNQQKFSAPLPTGNLGEGDDAA